MYFFDSRHLFDQLFDQQFFAGQIDVASAHGQD